MLGIEVAWEKAAAPLPAINLITGVRVLCQDPNTCFVWQPPEGPAQPAAPPPPPVPLPPPPLQSPPPPWPSPPPPVLSPPPPLPVLLPPPPPVPSPPPPPVPSPPPPPVPSPPPPLPVASPPPAREPIGTWSEWFGAKKGPALYGGICPCGTFVKASAGARDPAVVVFCDPAARPVGMHSANHPAVLVHAPVLLQLWNIWTDTAFSSATETTPINGISGQCSDNSSLPVGASSSLCILKLHLQGCRLVQHLGCLPLCPPFPRACCCTRSHASLKLLCCARLPDRPWTPSLQLRRAFQAALPALPACLLCLLRLQVFPGKGPPRSSTLSEVGFATANGQYGQYIDV